MDLSWSSPAVGVKQLDGAVEVSVSQPPDGDTAAVLCSATSTSRHVVCLCGTVASDGFYIVTSVTDNGATLVLKPTADNSLWQTTYGIVQEIHENNNFYIDKFPPTASADGSAGAIFVPQPLLFHCRVSIFGIDQVDTVNQTFRTEFYTDMRLRGMLHVADEAVGYALMTSFQLSTGLIAFMNVSEMVHDREVWSSINEGIEKDRPTFTIKMRLKVCLNEQMELENFPFDIQELNIPLTFNGSSNRIRLKSNSQYPSLFFCHQFQLASIYNVVYKDVVPTVVSLSDPRESSAGIMYPRCNFKVLLERKTGYYISNVAIPLTVLTALGPLSNALEIDGSAMGTGDRLSVTLTLILTAVAYKFVVASSLPQVSYLTLLDIHVLVCFVYLVANAVENVVYPVAAYHYGAGNNVENIFVIVYFVSFAIYHIVFFGIIALRITNRNAFFESDTQLELIRRAVQTVVYQQLHENREGPGDMGQMPKLLLPKFGANLILF